LAVILAILLEPSMLVPSSNAYVFPLTVARVQGHGDVNADGGRALQLRLDEQSHLGVVTQFTDGGWLAVAKLRGTWKTCTAMCSTPMPTPIQAEAHAVAALANENDLGYALANQLRNALARSSSQM
jgi:hypothetical protein